jgi:hypothetical protein
MIQEEWISMGIQEVVSQVSLPEWEAFHKEMEVNSHLK